MDFFDNQDAARRRTGWLMFLFLAAVVAIILLVYVVVALSVYHSWDVSLGENDSIHLGRRIWDPSLFAIVSLGTIVVIAAGSLYKIAELSSGGESVALSLGGRRIDQQTADLAERRLLNVVEEMALASGVPVPPVYVLDHEPSINAFAAGHTPANAVVAVSRGCLDYLNRDELQGVMGHEFSHILNGDMRLNIRLIGVLNGILLLAIIGYYILRTSPSSDDRSEKKSGGGLVLVGLGLLAVGYIGLFFAKLIRSSVSRQREYLADASAVQFTRYPQGIGGALKKIGGLSAGSAIRDRHADEVSHMFFGDAFATRIFGFFATHPPLEARIRRIDPSFDGTFPATRPLEEATAGNEAPSPRKGRSAAVAGQAAADRKLPTGRGEFLGQIGAMTAASLACAAELIDKTPKPLADAAAEPYGARAVICAVLLDREGGVRETQLGLLKARTDQQLYREIQRIVPVVDSLAEGARLPLVDRTFPALKQLSPKQYGEFRDLVEALVRADGKVDLLEYTIQTMLVRTLDLHFNLVKPPRVQYYSVLGVIEPAATVLSTLAYAGSDDLAEAQRAYELGMGVIGKPAPMRQKCQCTLDVFDAALGGLVQTAPKVKRQIVAACAACVAADGTVTVREGELLRAITSTLGCPMPPISVPANAAAQVIESPETAAVNPGGAS